MMETINIADCLASLPDGTASKIVGVNSTNNGVLALPKTITDAAGCGILNAALEQSKWYRIAIGGNGSASSSAIINIGKFYNNGFPASQLFYVSADAYSNGQTVIQLAKGGGPNPIGKVRIVYKASTKERSFLDIYIASLKSNDFHISYSNNVYFSFQKPEEVSADIPEGYSVKEFTF